MKEFPKFDYDGKEYDLCFYDDTVQLYAVQNRMSGLMVSQLIPAANDYVAAEGFKNFIEAQKEKKDTQVYALFCVGTLSIEKIQIIDSTKTLLFDSRDDMNKWLEDAKTFMLSWNDEE